jgi:hypothetical protein
MMGSRAARRTQPTQLVAACYSSSSNWRPKKNDGPIEVTVGERAVSLPAYQSSWSDDGALKAQREVLGCVTSPVWELAAPGEPVLARGLPEVRGRETRAQRYSAQVWYSTAGQASSGTLRTGDVSIAAASRTVIFR